MRTLVILVCLCARDAAGIHFPRNVDDVLPESHEDYPMADAAVTINGNGVLEWARQAFQKPTNDKFSPVTSMGHQISAILSDESSCVGNAYQDTSIERIWKQESNRWTKDPKTLCDNLHSTLGEGWAHQIAGETAPSTNIFSKLCKKSQKPQILEPLVGLLRSPRFLCEGQGNHLMDVDFLVLADASSAKLSPSAKRIFFDAGGSMFKDAMMWFTSTYAARGIDFDRIFVWEARHVSKEEYWHGIPKEVRAKWEPRLTYYSATYVSADPADTANNVVERIKKECKPDDFCAFKLDIDTPSVELPLVQQLRDSKDAQAKVDEFFFEHHITNDIMKQWWRSNTNGTFQDSYEIFQDLRSKGVRAHSWV